MRKLIPPISIPLFLALTAVGGKGITAKTRSGQAEQVARRAVEQVA